MSRPAALPLEDVLFEEARSGLCLVAPDNTVIRVNPEWLRSTGFTAEDAIGRDIFDLFPEPHEIAVAMHGRARSGHRIEVPGHARCMAERETWWEGSISSVEMDEGTGALISLREIWDVAEADREVARARAAELKAVMDSVPVAVFITHDRDAGTMEGNRHCSGLLRLPPGAHMSKSAPEEERPTNFRVLKDGRELCPDELPVQIAAARGIEVTGFEFDLAFDDGLIRHVVGNATPLRDATRGVCGSVGAFMDITEQKRAAEQVSHLAEILELGDPFVEVDSSWRIINVNKSEELFTNTPRSETVGRTLWDAFPDAADPDSLYSQECRRCMAERTPVHFDEYYPPRDGWINVTAYPTEVGGLAIFFRDVTDKVRAEQELRANEEKFRALFETARASEQRYRKSEERLRLALVAAQMTAWEYDPATLEVQLSENAEEVLGLQQRHQNSDQGYALIHPDDVEPHRALVTAALESGGSYVSVYRYQGEEVTWLEEHGTAVVDEGGKTVRLVGVVQNITERKRVEEALQESHARKDQFIAMLSHELRNPLAPIRSSVFILRNTEPGGSKAANAIDVIERQAEHLTRLVDDLLDVTRISRGKIELKKEPVDLAALVEGMVEDFRTTMQERGIHLESVFHDRDLFADADPVRMAQVVGNLLHNASKFTPTGGAVAVTVAHADGEAEICVEDTGRGIEAELLPKIFETFVQGERELARSEGGLGLGLALVKGITELHDGRVRAESRGPGKGARFILHLPLTERVATEKPCPESALPEPANHIRVLVVDDNRDAANSLAVILETLGYVADIAYDGPGAVATALVNRPDIVLCDIGLPGMSGYEVAQSLRQMADKQMLMVAITGYARREDIEAAKLAGFDQHLAKPVNIRELIPLLRDRR